MRKLQCHLRKKLIAIKNAVIVTLCFDKINNNLLKVICGNIRLWKRICMITAQGY